MKSLKQNWFMDKKFIMFKEDYDGQYFFDKETKCIYYIFEDVRNRITIKQYDEEDEIYDALCEDYLDFCGIKRQFVFNVNTQVVVDATSYEEAYDMVQKRLDEIEAEDYREIYK